MISAIERLRALRAGRSLDFPGSIDLSSITVEEAISRFGELGLRYEFEERAAILEYDGGLSREEADCQAVREIAERIDWMKKNLNKNIIKA